MSLNLNVAEWAHVQEDDMARHIIDATREVFSTMMVMEVEDCYPLVEPVTEFHCSITGMVGLAGSYTGILSIHCPAHLAMKMTSNMLGMEVEEVGEDVNDALGEIANMLGGHVKQVLSKGGLDLNLSIPTVISGETYTIRSMENQDCVVIPFRCDGEKFLVGVTIRKEC
ncbi:MAG: chemotaxis protein CheX [Geobacteraceae bacterium]|jgi:chemotaxis protein CheX